MLSSFFKLFHKTQELESKISVFLDHIFEAGDLFEQALKSCFSEGYAETFLRLKEKVSQLEHENDSLRRDVENQLYVHMIVPDMRSDILKLLEGCDKIINQYEAYLIMLFVEKPIIPQKLHAPLLEIVKADLLCVSFLLKATRSFFDGKSITNDVRHIFPIEHQVDLKAVSLKEFVFENQKITLAEKLQLKEIIYGVEKISDIAESVADVLTIMAVKHV